MGNLGVTEDKEKISDVFEQLFFVGYWMYGFAGICLFEILNPFVELAFGEQYLFQRNIVLILCINFFINGMRKAVLIFKESMGLFWYDRYKALSEAVLNLSISILLVKNFGVWGVFAGTFCSTVLTSVWVEPCILYKYRFHRPVKEYFKTYVAYLLMMAAAWSLTEGICHLIRGGIFTQLFLRGLVCVTVPNLLLWLIFHQTEKWKRLAGLLKKIVKKVRKSFRR